MKCHKLRNLVWLSTKAFRTRCQDFSAMRFYEGLELPYVDRNFKQPHRHGEYALRAQAKYASRLEHVLRQETSICVLRWFVNKIK